MAQYRRQRMGDQIKVELADLLLREVRDPRIGFVTVTEVRMSPDLTHARAYVSILGDAEHTATAFAALRHTAGFLRAQLGRRLKLRHVPELRFVLDDTLDTSARIEALLQEAAGESDDG